MITFGERPPRSADIIAVKLIDQYRDHSRLYPECSNDRFCKLRIKVLFCLIVLPLAILIITTGILLNRIVWSLT